MKKGKISTVVFSCLATVVLGALLGFGGLKVYSMNREDVTKSAAPKVTPDRSVEPHDSISKSKGNYSTEYDAMELFEKYNDAVVGVKLVNSGLGGEPEVSEVIGSGVIISEDGIILTCAHVVDGGESVKVVVDDYDDPSIKHEYDAELYGSDAPTDLAVLKIERDEAFRHAEPGNSSNLKIGQTVVAIGNPVGLHKTITQGIVSGLQRDLGENAYMLPSIQTDAALNPGNSGCPLFDMYGNVVGIVNIKLVSGAEIDNLGFAISIDEAWPIINDLITNGYVTSRAMLGITAKELTPNDGYSTGEVSQGLYVDSIRPGTPAADSGLMRGDIIIKIDGNDVTTVADIQSVIKDKSVGDVVELTVVRYNNFGEKSEINISLELASMENDE